MKLKYFFLIISVKFISILAYEDLSEISEDITENSREIRDHRPQDWYSIEYQPQRQPQEEWIPQTEPQPSFGEIQPKRRRLRKRKRKPTPIVHVDDSNESSSTPVYRKRIHRPPQRLDQIKNDESWMENEDQNQKPYIRRKIVPNYEENEENEPIKERIRDPFTALQEAEEKQKKKNEEFFPVGTLPPPSNFQNIPISTTSKKSLMDLKLLLKQQIGGQSLSLSEILQQKNLSLSELLKGNQKAISALTESSEASTEGITEPTTSFKTNNNSNNKFYKRLPPSKRKNFNQRHYNEQQTTEDQSTIEDVLTSRELLEAQRKRLAILHKHKENKIYADLKKFDVIPNGGSESTTEKKRIFVPSHPKYYTSMDYKLLDTITPNTEEYEENQANNAESTNIVKTDLEITTNPSVTTNNPILPTITMKKKLMRPKLPITSAKINKLLSTTKSSGSTENYPQFTPKPIQIKLNEIFGFHKFLNNQTQNDFATKNEDRPLKIDLNEMLEKISTSSPNPEITKQDLTTNPTEKLKYVTAKEEIMEILNDPKTRDNLSKILRNRNMTVEELVEQRERGSSQLHLADIFHNKTKEPEPKNEPLIIGHISSPNTNFEAIPIYRQEKSLIFPLDDTKIEIKPLPIQNQKTKTFLFGTTTIMPNTNRELYRVTSFPTYKIEMDKTALDLKNLDESKRLEPKTHAQSNLPQQIWKQLYPDFFTEFNDVTDSNSIDRLEEVDNQLTAEQSNDRLNLDYENLDNGEEDDEEFFRLPSGVKSAIIASSIIIGSSLVVFLTILFIFKWTQKERQRRRLIYNSSFNGGASKFRSNPILDTLQQKRSLRTFVSETLGRKKNYYKSHMQSMTDSIWDNNEKKTYLQ